MKDDRPASPTAERRFPTILLLIVAGIFILLSCLVFWDLTSAFDVAVERWVQAQSTPLLDRLMQMITHGGDRLTHLLISAALSIFFLWRRRWRAAATIWMAIGAGYAINSLLKLFFGRTRPDLSLIFIAPSGYSYPSGHAMASTVVYGCAAFFLARLLPHSRVLIRALAIIIVFFIGLSRIYLDAHWPTDVLAGFAVGGLVLAAIIKWYDIDHHPI
jgi:undecaprenyl-diphosphatase